MARSKIESAVLAATKQEPKGDDEKYQAYLLRLVKAVDALDEKTWRKLPDSAQDWHEAGVNAVKAGKPIQNFSDVGEDEPAPAPKAKPKATPVASKPAEDDDDEPEAGADEDAGEDAGDSDDEPADEPAEDDEPEAGADEDGADEDEPAPVTKPKPSKLKVAAEDKPAKAPKPPKAAKEPKGPGATNTLMGIVIEDPGLSKAEALEKLAAAGMTMSPAAASTGYYMTHLVLRALKDRGVLDVYAGASKPKRAKTAAAAAE